MSADGIPAGFLANANPTPGARTHERTDPYWDNKWVPGSQAIWTSKASAPRFEKSKARLSMPKDKALSYVTGSRKRTTTLALAALLDSYATITAEQAAAFAGDDSIIAPYSTSPGALFSLGTMDIGRYPAAIGDRVADSRDWVYRRSTNAPFDRDVASHLTYTEWASVTGGMPFAQTPVHDRHNTLAAELLLRTAEFLDPAVVLGEKFCDANMLTLGRADTAPPTAYTHRADGLIVRRDGMRIAVEITASKSRNLVEKVRRWARLLSNHRMDTSGLMVLFVIAPHPGAPSGPAGQVRSVISQALRDFPGTSKDAAAARIGVVEWQDWFPGAHLIGEDFLNMRARFPIGKAGTERWQPVDLASYSFDPADEFDALALTKNAKALASVPHWQRVTTSSVIGTPLERSGRPLPVSAYTRPERAMFAATPKQGWDATPPQRLLFA